LVEKGVSQCGVAKPRIGNVKKKRNMILEAWKENCSNRRKQKVCKGDL
jgi:hypothetical protein